MERQSCFSSSLSVWAVAVERTGSALMTFEATDAIAAVNIARLTNTTSMLPVALYMRCQLGIETILDGITREDGTVKRIAHDDVLTCMAAQRILTHRTLISAYRMFAPLSGSGCTDHVCHLMLQVIRDNIFLTYQQKGGSE